MEKIQSTFFMVDYQKVGNKNPLFNLDINKLKGAFKKYQEQSSKMLKKDVIDFQRDKNFGSFKSYLENKNKMVKIENEEYWFSKNSNIKTYENYLERLEEQIKEDPINTKNYYGVISFTPEQLELMGIDRYKLKLEDIKFLKGIINNAIGDLGKYHFKEGYGEFNSISIFHNNEKHFHAHINFSSSISLDKIPLYRLARVHLKLSEAMISRMNCFLVNDKDFRNKEIKKDIDIYDKTIKKIKSMNLSSYRYKYLKEQEKEIVDKIFKDDIEKIYEEEFNLLKKQYKDMSKKFKDIGNNKGDSKFNIEYNNLVDKHLDEKYRKDYENKRVIVINQILKLVKEDEDFKSLEEIYIKQEKFLDEKKELKDVKVKINDKDIEDVYFESNKIFKNLENKSKTINEFRKKNKYKKNVLNMKKKIKSINKDEIDLNTLDKIKLKYMNQEQKEELLRRGEINI